MSDSWSTIQSLAGNFTHLLSGLLVLAATWAVVLFWLAWSTFAIDWRRLGPYLAQGAAIPLVMVAGAIALAWAAIWPHDLRLFGATVPNYLWQVLAAGLFLGITLFCGWLQVRNGWYPREVAFDPPGGAHGHGHDDHGHGHDDHGHHHDHAAAHGSDRAAHH